MGWLERKLEAMIVKMVIKAIKDNIKEIERIDTFVRKYNYQNEQWFLDWQDKLNEISVR